MDLDPCSVTSLSELAVAALRPDEGNVPMALETPLRVHQGISAKAQEPLHQGISAKAQEPFASRHKCESTGSLAHAPSTATPAEMGVAAAASLPTGKVPMAQEPWQLVWSSSGGETTWVTQQWAPGRSALLLKSRGQVGRSPLTIWSRGSLI